MQQTDEISHKIASESYRDLEKNNNIKKVQGKNYRVIEKRDDTQNGKIYLISNFVYKI
ncbi:MAG: hypothetical protein E7H07_08415 [Staphylococcus epidermidis]|nr:hypothetical protein [Staphylococcus epidermidis]